MSENCDSITHSFIWKLMERGMAQLITLIVQIVLARILLPDEFGVISILLIFINISNVFIQKGFASSLIRKEKICDNDYNTAFVVSEIVAFICVAVLFVCADGIQSFYAINNFALYMRVLSISLFFGALYSVQNAELVRKMQFKQIFYRSIAATIGSGIIGIVAAVLNLGVWALILQTLSQQVIVCITTMVACKWKPRIIFSRTSFKELFSFGSKILIAEIISIGVENLRTLIIGKKYSASDLAYYDRGQVYPATAMRSIYDTIGSVMLPVFSKLQTNKENLAESVTISLELSTFLVAPLFIGVAAFARPFILLLLTEKWEAAIPYLIVFCIYQVAFPLYGILRQCLYALGKSDDVLKIEIVRSIIFILAIIIGVCYSPFLIAVLSCVAMYITTIIYLVVISNMIPINIINLIKNISVTIMQCVAMAVIIIFINKMHIPNILLIVIDIVFGALVYMLLSIILKNKSFSYCINYVRDKYIKIMKSRTM